MSKESKRLRTTAARVIRASREHTGELRKTLFEIAVEYKKQAHKAELRRGENPRSKNRTAQKKKKEPRSPMAVSSATYLLRVFGFRGALHDDVRAMSFGPQLSNLLFCPISIFALMFFCLSVLRCATDQLTNTSAKFGVINRIIGNIIVSIAEDRRHSLEIDVLERPRPLHDMLLADHGHSLHCCP